MSDSLGNTWFGGGEATYTPSYDGYPLPTAMRAPAAAPIMRPAMWERLNALAANVAVLDHCGEVLAVNDAWRNFAKQNGMGGSSYGIGMNYLQICEHASGEEAREARLVADGIREVINGRYASVYLRYGYETDDRRHLFAVRVSRVRESLAPRIVVAHERIL